MRGEALGWLMGQQGAIGPAGTAVGYDAMGGWVAARPAVAPGLQADSGAMACGVVAAMGWAAVLFALPTGWVAVQVAVRAVPVCPPTVGGSAMGRVGDPLTVVKLPVGPHPLFCGPAGAVEMTGKSAAAQVAAVVQEAEEVQHQPLSDVYCSLVVESPIRYLQQGRTFPHPAPPLLPSLLRLQPLRVHPPLLPWVRLSAVERPLWLFPPIPPCSLWRVLLLRLRRVKLGQQRRQGACITFCTCKVRELRRAATGMFRRGGRTDIEHECMGVTAWHGGASGGLLPGSYRDCPLPLLQVGGE